MAQLFKLTSMETSFSVNMLAIHKNRPKQLSLKEAIARAAGDDRSQPVILRADGRTPHQAVVTAMDALGQLGFQKLSIATTPEQRKP